MAFYNAGLFLVLFLSLIMILLVGGRIRMQGAVPMLLLLTGMSVWSLCQLLHIFVIDPHVKYFWYQAKFVGIVMIPAALVLLAVDLSGRKNLIKPWHAAVLAAFPLLTLLAVATDSQHHLFRKSVSYVIAEQFIIITTVDGPAFWASAVYSYLLILFSIALLADKARKSAGTERNQCLLMLLGCVFPWIWNVVYLLMLDPLFPLDYTPVFMVVTEVVFLITLFYFRMFNIVPFTKRAVFDSLEDLVVVLDRGSIIQDMNPAAREVFNMSGQPMGRNFSECTAFLKPPIACPLTEIQGEYQGFRSGRNRDYLATATPIAGKQGTEIGSLLVFKDITAFADSRRALESATGELAIQNEKKMQFVKQVNRNIRIPLNRALGFAEAFGQQPLSDSQREAVEHLSISGDHLIQLINDITDYSKIETGKMELVEESVQIFDLVRHVCRLYEYMAEEKGIKVKYRITPEVPIAILADSLRLTQVLSNIMGNAVKFTEKGVVSLTVSKLPEDWMEIAIADTGIGISQRHISSIFQAYQQVEEKAALKFGGTGLGLAIVKELVERMGGEIGVSSQPGEGTTFTLKLPCRASAVKSPVYNLEQMMDYKNRSLRIGLITRDPVQQTLIRRFFKGWPNVDCHDVQEPETARNPANGWDILLVNLEDVSGALLKRITSGGEDRPDLRPAVIGMTNDMDVMGWAHEERQLLDDCMLMPMNFKTLNRTLIKALLRQ